MVDTRTTRKRPWPLAMAMAATAQKGEERAVRPAWPAVLVAERRTLHIPAGPALGRAAPIGVGQPARSSMRTTAPVWGASTISSLPM